MTRRMFLASSPALRAAAAQPLLTKFQIGCMTLPYSSFTLDRALEGIAKTGYRFVAWGTTHKSTAGANVPVIRVDAPAKEARELGRRCRNMGLAPVMMFSTVHLEAKDAEAAHQRRIEQAAEAGLPFLLTFGKTSPGEYQVFVKTLQAVAPAAKAAKVTIAIKQHGGNSATGRDCVRILRDVGHESVKICYDAGNVLDYENADPIPDIQACWQDVRAFAIKDHRNTPQDQDCGPGFGEIDHYKLLMPVARTGHVMPLVCENIFEPVVPRPSDPEGVDRLARRAREFLETVVRGVQA